MADRSPRRGRRRKNTEPKSESEGSLSEMTTMMTETAAENQTVVQELEDKDGQSQPLDTLLQSLGGDGSFSNVPIKDDPLGEEIEAAVSGYQEQLESDGKDSEVKTLGDSEEGDGEGDGDGDGKGNREEEAMAHKQDVKGTVDQAELDKLFDPNWADLIKQLPEFCDPGLVLEENDHKEGNTKMMYQVPMMPIAQCVKEKWEGVNKELLESSQISPFRKLDDKRYWISDTDFKMYCQSSTVDREYCIQVEKEVMREESSFTGGPPRRRPFIKKSSSIRNPLLQACENGFKKCDESARMSIRASSHAAFMMNGLRNILEKSPSEDQVNVLRLLDGIQGSVESVADSSARVIARATVSRRNICMSQIQRHEAESFEDFITLPMDSKNLFHGEFYPTMQEHKKVNNAMKRRLNPKSEDFDHDAKRPSLMEASYSRQRSGYDQSYGGRYGGPVNRYSSWGGYNEGYGASGSGRGGHARRGNKRW